MSQEAVGSMKMAGVEGWLWARIHWRDNATGETGIYVETPGVNGSLHVEEGEINTWMWAQGNWSCDCNRGDFFKGDDFGCGDERFEILKLEALDEHGALVVEIPWNDKVERS